MFIDRAAQLGLLQHDPESSILTGFPLGVKKKLIHEVTQCLLPNSPLLPDPSSLLTSPAHVRWAMEVIGQGFALPIEDVGIIHQTIAVYSNWLLDPSTLPSAIQERKGSDVEQKFWQTIFQQFSLLFQPRSRTEMAYSPWLQDRSKNKLDPDDTDPLTLHVDLCHGVLKILTSAGRELGSEFSEETWIVLLKVMIGISDCLLREPMEKEKSAGDSLAKGDKHQSNVYEGEDAGPRMADELCEHLIRVLVELWLRSNLKPVYMWDHLKRYFTLWTHRVKVIRQWSATIFALTQRVAGLLYGTKEGAENVHISIDSYSVTLDLPPDFVYYAWHRMIYLIGNPNALRAANFEVAIKGIARVVHVWHSIGIDADPLDGTVSTIPDGNTLLHMLGGWLFEAAPKMGPEYAEGKAEALGILCRIFCQPQRRRKFLRTYLERFYTALKDGLRSDAPSLTAIMLNTGELFVRDLEGVRLLAPDFVIALRRILPTLPPVFNAKVDPEDLRRAAYRVMGCILGLPNHFDEVPVGTGWEMYDQYNRHAGGAEEVVLSKMIKAMYAKSDDATTSSGDDISESTFRTLKSHILEVLLTSLIVEHSPVNARYVLHLLNTFVAEDAAFCPGLPALAVKTIQEKLISGWPPDVMKTAFQALNHFAAFYKYIRRDNKSCPRELVLTLCRYIDTSLLEDNLVAVQSLIISAYDCMIRWAVVGQWIVDDRDCHNAVIATLCRGIGVLERDDDFAAVSNGTSAHAISHSHGLSSSSTGGSVKDAGNGLSSSDRERVPTVASVQSIIASVNDKKKAQRHSMAASKLIPKLRSSTVPISTTPPVSTGTKDGGLGLPTFANLTAEMMIKSAAEMGMAHMLNQLGNFPPYGEVTGVTRISSIWNEEAEVRRIVGVRDRLKAMRTTKLDVEQLIPAPQIQSPEDIGGDVGISDYRRYIRYYAYDRRVIMGIIETPHWAVEDDLTTGNGRPLSENRTGKILTPRMTLVLRESTGKYTWMTSLKYTDESKTISSPHASTESALVLRSTSEITVSPQHHGVNPQLVLSPTTTGRHFTPAPYPYTPRNASVVEFHSINDSSIPSLDDIIPLGSDSSRCHGVVKAITEKWTKQEQERAKEVLKSESYRCPTAVTPPRPVDLTDPDLGPQSFRLFLGQLGFLTPESQSKLWPLQMSDALLKDLQKIDGMPERDCMSMCVLFCRSGHESLDDILGHRTVSHDFDEFVHCLGWPVDLSSHTGYKGNLDKSICATAPYFASRHAEVIFHSPYYIRDGHVSGQDLDGISDTTPSTNSRDVQSSMGTSGHRPFIDTTRRPTSGHFPSGHEVESPTLSQRPWPNEPNRPRASFFTDVAHEDLIYIVWVEDMHRYTSIPRKLSRTAAQLFIFVHPLPHTPGMYFIRVVSNSLSFEDLMNIGPLLDGMVISRHILGMLVRTTAISGHKYCRTIKGTFRRPPLIRRHHIEEVCNRHKTNMSIGRFYADLFT
ncbi:uncharacterized protein SPPG_09225 [Spizellomyces punctatus DAOM BR117]|uniref:Rap-GAP domain-containing protein n=1 Tax=Spizellomyces punctatus (strain DAOM BR117) TaxID=645134 RepID=A0A0L0HHH6_SPIPD|nr:uncharacterized protein SPPG_09225 [Spizellomyces punctatus DAOM BR117]KND00537.1 hypothetical protein SPPG_09225 [Spizellomyces punctatus DAOM BR117]|eukprot:XP_016608576.1 hypothetical protein SPPG_09225 [Spizellomyces punctatus DAOM BR117]